MENLYFLKLVFNTSFYNFNLDSILLSCKQRFDCNRRSGNVLLTIFQRNVLFFLKVSFHDRMWNVACISTKI